MTLSEIQYPELSTISEVYSSVYSPDYATKGERFLIQVFVHTKEENKVLKKIALYSDSSSTIRGTSKLSSIVASGTELTLQLISPGIKVDEPLPSYHWDGTMLSIPFTAKIPGKCMLSNIVGTIRIIENGVPIGHLKFRIGLLEPNQQAVGTDKGCRSLTKMKKYKNAFISYTSIDRAEVLKRVQMLSLVNINFFQDILSLEPGEK